MLFSPEHGIRGSVDAAVKDSVDAATGLPVFSLYGERTRPTAGPVAGLDTLVYDIQDVGTRFYTYISTLGLCLETSAAHHLRFVVLDRPNPIGGIEIEGPLADPDRLDFTAYHPIPVRHGLTVGELARLFAAEKKLNVDLTVIPIENWHRADWWDATNLPGQSLAEYALADAGLALSPASACWSSRTFLSGAARIRLLRLSERPGSGSANLPEP